MAPAHQDAEMILRLYELFESERLRAARKWLIREFTGEITFEEFAERWPKGSDGFDHFTGLYGFFEMVGTLFKHNLVHPDLLFDMWYVNGFYIRMYPVIDGWRKQGDVHIAENFEYLARAELEWIGRVKGEQYVPQVPYLSQPEAHAQADG